MWDGARTGVSERLPSDHPVVTSDLNKEHDTFSLSQDDTHVYLLPLTLALSINNKSDIPCNVKINDKYTCTHDGVPYPDGESDCLYVPYSVVV